MRLPKVRSRVNEDRKRMGEGDSGSAIWTSENLLKLCDPRGSRFFKRRHELLNVERLETAGRVTVRRRSEAYLSSIALSHLDI